MLKTYVATHATLIYTTKLSIMLNEPEIYAGETAIKRVRFSKTLGVFINAHVTWERQIENIQTKILDSIGMLWRVKKLVPKATSAKVYNAIILPHFNYCRLVCDNCGDYFIYKFQKLQNRAARIVTGKTYETRSLHVLKELHWQPFKERFKQQKLIFMHKIRITKCQLAQQTCFIPKRTHGITSVATTEISEKNRDFEKSTSYAAASAGNNLPPEAIGSDISCKKYRFLMNTL